LISDQGILYLVINSPHYIKTINSKFSFGFYILLVFTPHASFIKLPYCMESAPTENDFLTITKLVLEQEFSIYLDASIEIKKKNTTDNLDYYDPKTYSHITILNSIPTGLLSEISRILNIVNKSKEDIKNLYIIFKNNLSLTDKNVLKNEITETKEILLTILDEDDILNIANKHKISAFNKDNSTITSNILPSLETLENISKAPKTKKSSFTPKKTKPDPNKNVLEQETKDFIQQFAGEFYLVSSHSLKKKRKDYFFNNNIWEKDDLAVSSENLINNVLPNDILILKTTGEKETKNVDLYIQGFGIVTENLQNGKTLQVDWIIKDVLLELEVLGYYRKVPISEPNQNDLITILSKIKNRWKALSSKATPKNNITTVTKINSMPGITSDADSGEDLLNISRDVAAFARVIATKSFTPPLAIALFGTWGSGKSFFMRKLKERILTLSNKRPESGFCEGIAHVHFNAWSYMDTNLWAGIITKIFEGLNLYINNEENAAANHKKEIEEAIAKELSITQNEITKLETEIKGKDAQLKVLEVNRNKKKEGLDTKIKQIRGASLQKLLEKVNTDFQVQKKINEAINNNTNFIKKKDQFNKIIPDIYWKNPEEIYRQSISITTFIRTLFLKQYRWINLAYILVIFLLILVVPKMTTYITTAIGITDFGFITPLLSILTILGGVCTRGISIYKTLQPVIGSFWNIRENYIEKKEEAIFSFQQDEKALALEIEQIKDEITDISHQIYQTEEQKAALVYRKDNTLSTEALKSFIEKRSTSIDYKKHLGLVSIIRNDFEILSTLFSEHINEVENSKKESVKKFRACFERPLERIVFILTTWIVVLKIVL